MLITRKWLMPQYFRYEKINSDIVEESIMKDWCALGATLYIFLDMPFISEGRHKSLASLATSSIPMFVVNPGNFLVPGMRSPDVHPNYPYWENIIMSADRLGKTSTKLSCFPVNVRRIVRRALVHRGGLYDRLLSGKICKISCIFIRIRADVLRRKEKNDETKYFSIRKEITLDIFRRI